MNRTLVVAFSGLAVVTVMLSGCRINKSTHGDSKDVSISTPFGGLNVKTNDADVLANIGLPAYPGAAMVKKDKDNGSADVDLSFGGFQLRVKAMSFRTDDPPDNVEAFYRNGLKRFGEVIACRDDRPLGSPTRTAEGLTCDNMNDHHITVENHPARGELELMAGSQQHRHIVAIDPDGGGTKFGLVALDLPGKMGFDGESDSRRQ